MTRATSATRSDRLDAADKFVGLGDLLPLGAHDADRRRPARAGCARACTDSKVSAIAAGKQEAAST